MSRDEFQYIDEQCEPVSRAVNLGKDVVGYLLVDNKDAGDSSPGAFDPQFFS